MSSPSVLQSEANAVSAVRHLSPGSAAAIAAWLLAIGAGLSALARFETTPGAAGAPPDSRPDALIGVAGSERPLLLMFAHPRCACTHASLAALRQIVEACPGAADVR